MNKQKLSVTGTGDSLFMAKFPEEYQTGIRSVADFIQSCDIKITNLETNLSDFDCFASAYSGGTWLNTRGANFSELLRFGFNYFGTANNHAMDYGFDGLLSTLRVLDQHGVAHSGTGTSLEDASKPAVLEANGQKVAIFAVDASCENASRAGRATKVIKARPGVNYLRHEKAYRITPQEEQVLREIADRNGINFSRNLSINSGYRTPDPPGFFFLGDQKYTTRDDIPLTSCNAKDKARLIDAFRSAKEKYDYVFLVIHCHDNDGKSHDNPAAYLIEFAHACIDAGVSAIFGGGCHSLRPMEIYQGCPIFYSLGDFIYQGLKVEHLPADFMEKYDVDIFASAQEALFVRSRGGKVGLHCEKQNYQTVLPKIEFTDGKMSALSLLPVHLNFERKDDMNGLPVAAEGKEAQEIFEILDKLSKPYGVNLRFENGLIIPA
ncbi:MAG: CapA family protein [Lentisphaerae bacterium]|jgi:poly-gamma-glutamate synthesis protein (capsule biosynthesis protein)|nr:CapA family protein [Lentisphaerota bacterium]